MTSPDRLRAALAAWHLDRAEARFDFLVQVQTPPGNKAMPVEDATIEWSAQEGALSQGRHDRDPSPDV